MEKLYLKKRYPFTCPHCGKEHYARPSFFMTEFQLNKGRGYCLNQDKDHFLLEIDDKNKRMIAIFPIPEEVNIKRLSDNCYEKKVVKNKK